MLLKPSGIGGVATTVARLGDALARHVQTRVETIGRNPGEQIGTRAAIRGLTGMASWTRTRPVVHLHTSLRSRAMARDGMLAAAARARGCPVVLQVHGWDRTIVADPGRHRGLRRLLGLAHAVLAVDPGLRVRLEQIQPAPVQEVCNPYDPAEIPVSPERSGLRLLFLGRLTAGKGLRELVTALPGLRGRYPALAVELAGDGPERWPLQRLAHSLGLARHETFPGRVEGREKAACLARATVLVHPSPEESAPLAVIEGLAAGLPVIAVRTGAVPALVGPAGVVVREMTAATLAWAVEQVLRAPHLGGHGPGQVRGCHPDRVAAHLLSVYAAVRSAA